MIKFIILGQARLLSVPKVFCCVLVLLLSWPAITENLKIWPDLASLAALVFSLLTLCIIFFSLLPSTLLHKLSWRSCTIFRITYEALLRSANWSSLYRSYSCVHPELFMWLSVSHHSSEPGHEKMAQTEDTRREATSLTRVTPPDRYLTQDQSEGPSSHLTTANIPPSILTKRWNWGIFTKQNWEAGWNSSSQADKYFLICWEYFQSGLGPESRSNY